MFVHIAFTFNSPLCNESKTKITEERKKSKITVEAAPSVTRSLWPLPSAVYLFVGLMMMYLLLRAFHKMADLHGLTSFLELPHCDELEGDLTPILGDDGPTDDSPPGPLHHRAAPKQPLEPASQPSYNTISKG